MVDNQLSAIRKGNYQMDDMATYAVATTLVRNIAKDLDLVAFLIEHAGDEAGDTALTTLCSSMTMIGARYIPLAEKLSNMEKARTSVLEGQQCIDDALGQGRH